ncbi:MAG: hypothetical protein ABIG96_00065 [Candidatus Micrarchaeota archaeon]
MASASEQIFQKRIERHGRRLTELEHNVRMFFKGVAKVELAENTEITAKPKASRFPAITSNVTVTMAPSRNAKPLPPITVQLTSTQSTYNPSSILRTIEWGASVFVRSPHPNLNFISRNLHEYLRKSMLASHVFMEKELPIGRRKPGRGR